MSRVADPAVVGAGSVAPSTIGVEQHHSGCLGSEDLLSLSRQRQLLGDRLIQRALENGVELRIGVAAEDGTDTSPRGVEEEEQVIRIGMGMGLEHGNEHVHSRRAIRAGTPSCSDCRRIKRFDGDVHTDRRQLLCNELSRADLGRG